MTDDLTRPGVLLAGSGGAFGLYSWESRFRDVLKSISPADSGIKE